MEPGRQEAARERQQAEAVERGAELYALNCANCHGPAGEGKIGPALKGTQLNKAALEKIIMRGIPGTGMLAWVEEDGGPLKKHQIKDLVTFINNLGSALVTTPEREVKETEPGQAIFDQKCISCHSIGGGRIVGPDLKGVTEQRDRDWLIRFIVSPEKLIAQGDPLAERLVQEYDGISMPNMGLSESEAEEVLAYIEAQSGGK